MELFHFFLLLLAEFRNWGQRVCPSADGLYFDYGALVVMGTEEGEGAKDVFVPIKDLHLNSKKPGHPMAQANQQL